MLNNKVIIVFGGCGLIGREIVKDALNNGAIVINADINSPDYKLDITDNKAIKDLFKTVYEKYSKIDGVVNCAYPRTKDWGNKLEDIEFESWQKNVDMQLNPIITITQEGLKYMKEGSSFVNFGSIYGVCGNDFTIYEGTGGTSPAAYPAIKAGIINFTRYLASYVGHKGIRANCVSPGGVLDKQHPIFIENYSKRSPLKRLGKPEEMAPAVTFLLSDKASYITGHNLMVDGGWSAI